MLRFAEVIAAERELLRANATGFGLQAAGLAPGARLPDPSLREP
ncbi:hypothetical protein ABT173_43220 [Streptomyces sp. NPDC001795]